jgi:hypothetical protein
MQLILFFLGLKSADAQLKQDFESGEKPQNYKDDKP